MDIIFPLDIIKGYLSSKKKDSLYEKCQFKKVNISNNEFIQFSLFKNNQVFHENIKLEDVNEKLNELLDKYFNILEITTESYIYGYKISSKGKVLTNKRLNKDVNIVNLDNNRKKKYLIEEGMIIPP